MVLPACLCHTQSFPLPTASFFSPPLISGYGHKPQLLPPGNLHLCASCAVFPSAHPSHRSSFRAFSFYCVFLMPQGPTFVQFSRPFMIGRASGSLLKGRRSVLFADVAILAHLHRLLVDSRFGFFFVDPEFLRAVTPPGWRWLRVCEDFGGFVVKAARCFSP